MSPADQRRESTWSILFEEVLASPPRNQALQELGPVILYAVAVGALSLLMPLAVQTLVNTVAFGTLLQPLVVLSLALLVALAGSAMLNALSAWTVEVLERRFFLRWYLEISTRLGRLAKAEQNREELINRVFDIYATQKAIRSLLVGGLEALLTIFVGLVVLALYHPVLLGFAVFIAVALWIVLALPRQRGVRLALAESRTKYELTARLEEVAIAHRVHAASRHLMREVDACAAAHLDARAQHFRVVYRQRIALWTLQAMAMATLLGAGGWLVMDGQLTLGQLVASELIVSGVGLSIAKLGSYIDTAHDLVAAAAKLSHLRHGLNTVPSVESGTALEGAAWSVHVAHPQLQRSAAAGELLVIGSDEHTRDDVLHSLLLEAQIPDVRVEYDGVDARDLSHSSTRRRVCYVGRYDAFTGTVFDNASASRNDDLDRGRVRMMLDRVGLDADLDLRLLRSGDPLTRRELARLGIARAALSDAAVVVIDRTLDLFDAPEAQRLAAAIDGPTKVVLTDRRDFLTLLGGPAGASSIKSPRDTAGTP